MNATTPDPTEDELGRRLMQAITEKASAILNDDPDAFDIHGNLVLQWLEGGWVQVTIGTYDLGTISATSILDATRAN